MSTLEQGNAAQLLGHFATAADRTGEQTALFLRLEIAAVAEPSFKFMAAVAAEFENNHNGIVVTTGGGRKGALEGFLSIYFDTYFRALYKSKMTTKNSGFSPYVPNDSKLPELTFRALLLGIVMTTVFSVANAYLGLKAGMTISAMFPAAVVAMAAFRLPFMRGSILEENITRTTAAVGEALAAGAIFTLPAFLITEVDGHKIWEQFRYWESSLLVLSGGVLGCVLIVFFRRTLTIEMDLPFPEGNACFEMVKAGQKGETGARYLFLAMLAGGVIQLIKDSRGFMLVKESLQFIWELPHTVVRHTKISDGASITHGGAFGFTTPAASPALMSIGFIIGLRYALINAAGGILAWCVLIPLILFIDPDLPARLGMSAGSPDWGAVSFSVWYSIVRPMAIGMMLLATMYTLWKMRTSFMAGMRSLMAHKRRDKSVHSGSRVDQDLSFNTLSWLAGAGMVLAAAIVWVATSSVAAALATLLLLVVVCGLLMPISGYTVGLIGTSNQPISGLTLCGLIVSAAGFLLLSVNGAAGIAATLSIAAVVCCAASMSGDMIQNLRVGHLLGATPWRIQVAEVVGVLATAFFLILPIMLLHKANLATGGIGGSVLPAPQAGLMATLAKGILGGGMPWLLILVGALFCLFLIMLDAPSPMLIAIGMYLPVETSTAMLVGGLMKYTLDCIVERRKLGAAQKTAIENRGTLIASGFIAGEALTGVGLSALALFGIESLSQSLFGVSEFGIFHDFGGIMSLLVFGAVGYAFVWVSRKPSKS